MKIVDDKAVFSTGKQKYANCGVIGIDEGLDVTEGWDGGFYNHDYPELSAAEQIELADYMIDLWTKFKARAIDGR